MPRSLKSRSPRPQLLLLPGPSWLPVLLLLALLCAPLLLPVRAQDVQIDDSSTGTGGALPEDASSSGSSSSGDGDASALPQPTAAAADTASMSSTATDSNEGNDDDRSSSSSSTAVDAELRSSSTAAANSTEPEATVAVESSSSSSSSSTASNDPPPPPLPPPLGRVEDKPDAVSLHFASVVGEPGTLSLTNQSALNHFARGALNSVRTLVARNSPDESDDNDSSGTSTSQERVQLALRDPYLLAEGQSASSVTLTFLLRAATWGSTEPPASDLVDMIVDSAVEPTSWLAQQQPFLVAAKRVPVPAVVMPEPPEPDEKAPSLSPQASDVANNRASSDRKKRIAMGVVLGVVGALALTSLLLCACRHRRLQLALHRVRSSGSSSQRAWESAAMVRSQAALRRAAGGDERMSESSASLQLSRLGYTIDEGELGETSESVRRPINHVNAAAASDDAEAFAAADAVAAAAGPGERVGAQDVDRKKHPLHVITAEEETDVLDEEPL